VKLKKVVSVSILLAAVLFLGSCGIIYFGNTDDDLADLAAFASGLDAVARTIADDTALTETPSARTVQPNEEFATNDNGTVSIGADPGDFYTSNSDNSDKKGVIQVPASNDYLLSFYDNTAYKARFSIQPESNKPGYYRIKLSVYDTADFFLDHVYEEYLVAENSWASLDANGNPGFIDSYDRMIDGSRVVHKNFTGSADGEGIHSVYNIAVPEIPGNLEDYTFTISSSYETPSIFHEDTVIAAPERDVTGTYYSYKESTGNYRATSARSEAARAAASDPDFESITYYSEFDDALERKMAVFSLQEVNKSKDNYARTVTRTHETYDDSGEETVLEEKIVRSLTTFSWRDPNPWQHITRDISQTVNAQGLTVVDHTEGVYYAGSQVDGNPNQKTWMKLTQNSAGSSNYSGTMEISWRWSSWTETYNVTYNGKKFKTTSTGGYNSSRTAADRGIKGGEIELDLASLNTDFTLDLPAGSRFTGGYFNGKLVGSIRFTNGGTSEIEITGGTVLLDGKAWDPGK
jgi:Flp pilus assembly protein TadG